MMKRFLQVTMPFACTTLMVSPLDLTREILAEQNIKVDEAGFEAEMEAQRERARLAREQDDGMGGLQITKTIYLLT